VNARARRGAALVLVVLATSATVAGAQPMSVSSGLLATGRKTLTHATCVLTPATTDTYVDESAPATSFSTNSTLSTVSAPKRRRVLIVFDLSGCGAHIQNASADSATLQLTVTTASGGTRTLTVYRVTSSWAASVTWNTQPSIAGSATTSFTASASSLGAKQIDVSSDVNDFIQSSPTVLPPYSGTVANLGWEIRDENSATAGIVTMTSSEGSVSSRPKLTINYAY
jgi:hypothetical protein